MDQQSHDCNNRGHHERDHDQHDQHDQQHQQIMNRMDDIERKLDAILHKLDGSVIKSCDKMNTHIDFVNGVYDTVRMPLSYISNKFHKIASPFGKSKTIELPISSESESTAL